MAAHPLSRFSQQAVLLLAVTALVLCPTRAGWAQAAPFGPAIGLDEPSSENSRTPFEIHTTGVITPALARLAERTAAAAGAPLAATSAGAEKRHAQKRIAVVTLCITKFHATYEFAIGQLEAPGYPQLSTGQILQKVGKRQCDFDVVGPSALLSKVAQAQPGTPLRIVGMYVQYAQRLQLVSVDVVGEE
jgi:hypothetical protein